MKRSGDSVQQVHLRSLRVLAVLLLAALPTVAEEVSLRPSQDNTLYEEPGGLLSCGAGQAFIAGRTGGGLVRRAALQFDVSSIPPGPS